MGEAAPDPTPPRGRIRLVAFDLDGTLTRRETVCETIGRRLGHLRRVRALEALCAERRDRDSLRLLRAELASIYRASTRARLRASLSSLTLAPGTRRGFVHLRRSGVTTAIVSIAWEFAARWLAEKLGADHYVGTRFLDDGSVEHFWPEDKGAWLEGLMVKLGVGRHETAAVGDSWTDTVMFDVTGHAFSGGAAPPPYLG
jgi:HAD superfamily phosphoserine phosphatase-like hydrolase